nr:hypothetical protein [Tanacetum cinerariifolium]
MDMYMVLKKYKKQVWLCKNKWSRLFKTLEEINFRNMSLLIILEFLMRKHKECGMHETHLECYRRQLQLEQPSLLNTLNKGIA